MIKNLYGYLLHQYKIIKFNYQMWRLRKAVQRFGETIVYSFTPAIQSFADAMSQFAMAFEEEDHEITQVQFFCGPHCRSLGCACSQYDQAQGNQVPTAPIHEGCDCYSCEV